MASMTPQRGGIRPHVERRLQRRPTCIEAGVSSSAIGRKHGVISDISCMGCRITAPCKLHAGDFLAITIPGLSALGAAVVWAKGGLAGLRFNQPMNASVLEHMLAGNRRMAAR